MRGVRDGVAGYRMWGGCGMLGGDVGYEIRDVVGMRGVRDGGCGIQNVGGMRDGGGCGLCVWDAGCGIQDVGVYRMGGGCGIRDMGCGGDAGWGVMWGDAEWQGGMRDAG